MDSHGTATRERSSSHLGEGTAHLLHYISYAETFGKWYFSSCFISARSVYLSSSLHIDFSILLALNNSESALLTCAEALYWDLSKIRLENEAYYFKQFSPIAGSLMRLKCSW